MKTEKEIDEKIEYLRKSSSELYIIGIANEEKDREPWEVFQRTALIGSIEQAIKLLKWVKS